MFAMLAGAASWFESNAREPFRTHDLAAVPLTTYPGEEHGPSLSPDGTRVAFSWIGENRHESDIFVKTIGSDSKIQLTDDSAFDFSPAWSPDGERIAFLRKPSADPSDAEVFVVPALGGTEQRLYRSNAFQLLLNFGTQLAWSPDGKWLVLPARPESTGPIRLAAISLTTGEKRWLTEPEPGMIGDRSPAFSSDARTLAFVRREGFGSGHFVYLLDLSVSLDPSFAPRRIATSNSQVNSISWIPAQDRLVLTEGPAAPQPGLWMASAWDDGATFYWPERHSRSVSTAVTPEGTLRTAYQTYGINRDVWLADLSGAEPIELPLVKTTASEGAPAFLLTEQESHTSRTRPARRKSGSAIPMGAAPGRSRRWELAASAFPPGPTIAKR